MVSLFETIQQTQLELARVHQEAMDDYKENNDNPYVTSIFEIFIIFFQLALIFTMMYFTIQFIIRVEKSVSHFLYNQLAYSSPIKAGIISLILILLITDLFTGIPQFIALLWTLKEFSSYKRDIDLIYQGQSLIPENIRKINLIITTLSILIMIALPVQSQFIILTYITCLVSMKVDMIRSSLKA